MMKPHRFGLSFSLLLLIAGSATLASASGPKKKKASEPSALDRYLQEALKDQPAPVQPSPGSLWSPGARLMDIASDVRAARVDDMVTVVVSENATAVATGATQTARASAAQSSITALGGVKSPSNALSNLLNTSTSTSLNGAGTTSRGATITATLSARVTHVLPNGYLVVEGTKDVVVNSEHQLVTVRGVIRPADLTSANMISSNQIAQMEIKIDGKGVINDAVRRPNFLYRLILGLLPF